MKTIPAAARQANGTATEMRLTIPRTPNFKLRPKSWDHAANRLA
jgi:hypothetical protein